MVTDITEELISSKRLAGNITGGRQDKTVYVPDLYTRAQNQWIDSFFKQNGYLGMIKNYAANRWSMDINNAEWLQSTTQSADSG